MESFTTLDTPLGRYAIAASGDHVTRIRPHAGEPPRDAAPDARTRATLAAARAALDAYFAGQADALDALPLAPAGSAFQRRVWRALREIPAGHTAAYGDVARRIGRPGAARAVGAASRANPVAIAIPCHRVVGADGRLVGYAGGLDRKRRLIEHERAASA